MKVQIEINDFDIRQQITDRVAEQYLNNPEKMEAFVKQIENAGWLAKDVKEEIVRRITDAVLGNGRGNDFYGLDQLIPNVIAKLDSDFLKEQIMARLINKI